MKNNVIYNPKKIVFHTLGWIIFSVVIFFPLNIFNSTAFALGVTVGVVFPLIIPVYLHFFLMDNYFDHKKYWTYGIWTFILVIGSSLFAQWFVEYMWTRESDNMNAYLDPLLVIIVTSGVRYYYKGIKLQLQLQEAQSKQYQAELDLLKFQVNPHFFFNTLNNLFSMARKSEDQSTAKGIAKLSHIMRYIIYDSNVDKIELRKEIEQINNFIELQKLRFSEDDEIMITFDVEGDIDSPQIAPMLLIPFVENAFKHGISLANNSPIEIKLAMENNELFFSIKNRINKLRIDRIGEHSGIGLQNVKRRLELLYKDNHDLSITNSGDDFIVNLKLKL